MYREGATLSLRGRTLKALLCPPPPGAVFFMCSRDHYRCNEFSEVLTGDGLLPIWAETLQEGGGGTEMRRGGTL